MGATECWSRDIDNARTKQATALIRSLGIQPYDIDLDVEYLQIRGTRFEREPYVFLHYLTMSP